ncbi:MAG: hypothetical protein R3Y16_01335 [Rikenellaceae bacterium]
MTHIVFFAEAPSEELPHIFFIDILDAIIGAILGIAGIDLIYQKRSERDLENDTAANIISALVSKDRDDTHPRLYELYNKEAVERALVRSIESYCASEQMAELFLSYIKKSCNLVKVNESYVVTISQNVNNAGGSPDVYIKQELKQTRVFRQKTDTTLYLYSFFVFRAGEEVGNNNKLLDEKLKDDKYYMREEFCNPVFVNTLISIDREDISFEDKRDKILAALKYRVELYDPQTNRPIDSSRISYVCEFVKDENSGLYLGLEVRTPLPLEVISDSDIFYKEENFRRYTANLYFEYMALPQLNTFYTVFSVPTIGSHFELIFQNVPNIDVNYMPFISFAQNEIKDVVHSDPNDGHIVLRSSVLQFKTRRTILPRSGISIFWSTCS